MTSRNKIITTTTTTPLNENVISTKNTEKKEKEIEKEKTVTDILQELMKKNIGQQTNLSYFEIREKYG